MINFKKSSFLILLFFVLFSCNENSRQIKFDKNNWNEETDPAFPPPYRTRMLKDLTTNYKLVGLERDQLIELLGTPDNTDSSSLTYKIAIDYGLDIDPVYMKNLKFSCSVDDVITSFDVYEWKN